MFAIEVISSPHVEFGEPVVRGRITLGEFEEEFVAPLVFWSAEDYRRQWREAAELILRGTGKTCFVVAMRASPADGAIFFWSAYKFGSAVYFQHQLLLPETVSGNFDPSNPFAQIGERQVRSETGERISEWQVSWEDILRFLPAS